MTPSAVGHRTRDSTADARGSMRRIEVACVHTTFREIDCGCPTCSNLQYFY